MAATVNEKLLMHSANKTKQLPHNNHQCVETSSQGSSSLREATDA